MTLPRWTFVKEHSPEWVALLQVMVKDGRQQSAGRFARRYKLDAARVQNRFRSMLNAGLVERVKGWDGWMYQPSDHGRKVAERGW